MARIGLAALGLLIALSGMAPAWGKDARDEPGRERAEIVARIESYSKSLDRSQASLARAEKAVALSRELGDRQALDISERAVQNARTAIHRLQRLHGAEMARLQRFDTAQRRNHLIRSHEGSAVRRARGTVTRTGGKPLDAPLAPGDTITTGHDGSFEVSYPRGSAMKLGPNTTLRILDDGEWAYYQGNGKIHRVLRCLNDRWACQRRHLSPGVAIGVRGTEYETVVDGEGRTTVRVFEGTVALTAQTPGAATVTVDAGNQVTVDRSGTVVGRATLDRRRFARWWRD